MFERAKIGGHIYNMADALTRDGAPVDRRVIEMFNPFMDVAVKYMKLEKLQADQAAIAMIINLANTFVKDGLMQKIFDERYDMFISFLRLFHAACLVLDQHDDRYRRARALYDADVFRALEEMN